MTSLEVFVPQVSLLHIIFIVVCMLMVVGLQVYLCAVRNALRSLFKVVRRQLQGRTDSLIMQLVLLWLSIIYMGASQGTACMT